MPKYIKSQKAFTLIELLIVIAIIGLLATIVFASLNSARAKAKDTRIISNVSSMRKIAEQLVNEYNSYDYQVAGIDARLCSDITPVITIACCLNEGAVSPYGSQIQTIKNDIIANGADAANIKCGSYATKYCVSAPLNSGGNFCIDSSGFTGTGKICIPFHINGTAGTCQ